MAALALAVAAGVPRARADFLVSRAPTDVTRIAEANACGTGFEPFGTMESAVSCPVKHHHRKAGLLEVLVRRFGVLSTVLFLPPDSGGTPTTTAGGSTVTGSGSPGSTTSGSPGGHPQSAPEPSTLLAGLIGAGALGLFLWLRARKHGGLAISTD
jgi:hypothetical protein